MTATELLRYPDRARWPDLCARPEGSAGESVEEIESVVESVMERVRSGGDDALRELTLRFDGVLLHDFSPTREEWRAAERIDPELRRAIDAAAANIRAFHAAQADEGVSLETCAGVRCWRRSVPIERVGLYVPGGSAPLFSTLLMLGVPARLAGCRQVVVVTPPGRDGRIDPAILYAARSIGVGAVLKAGGAQAVAALAWGTESVPRVDKIFGPGNRYVTAAKMLAQRRGVAIDLPAGPSEVLVIADRSAVPSFVAADLLSQAEHGGDSQVMLLLTDEWLWPEIADRLTAQLDALPRREIARRALAHSRVIVLRDVAEAVEFSNAYAPEHLILAVADPDAAAARVINAGSVFLGHYTPESLGDYASGTNHTLPTGGHARGYGGVSLESFMKKITFQRAEPHGLLNIGPVVERLARAELLQGHATAVSVRLAAIRNGIERETEREKEKEKEEKKEREEGKKEAPAERTRSASGGARS